MIARSAATHELRRRLGPQTAPSRIVGLEHEFRLTVGGIPADFRLLVDRVVGAGGPVDPADRHAHRRAWGGVVTADGPEAEIATPPVGLGPGFSGRLAALADAGRADLASLLPEAALQGYSTHLNVEVPNRQVVAATRRFTERFAPALMLMADRSDSPGLLVRPRPNRAEFGTEFVDGEHLRASALLATGGVLAGIRGRPGRRGRRPALPPALRASTVPDPRRFGWFVGRGAFGGDLYASGRDTPLPLAGGGTIPAGEHLRLAWASATAVLDGLVDPAELAFGAAVVDGREPLRIESPDALVDPWVAHATLGATVGPLPEGDLLRPRTRGTVDVRAVVVRWEYAVFRVADGHHSPVYASIARRHLGAFLARLDAGALDDVLAMALARPPRGATLSRFADTTDSGFWDGIAVGGDLAPTERGPMGAGDRPGKRPTSPPRTVQPPPGDGRRWTWPMPVWLIVAIVLVLLVAGVAAGSGLLGGGSPVAVVPTASPPPAGASAPPTSTTQGASPSVAPVESIAVPSIPVSVAVVERDGFLTSPACKSPDTATRQWTLDATEAGLYAGQDAVVAVTGDIVKTLSVPVSDGSVQVSIVVPGCVPKWTVTTRLVSIGGHPVTVTVAGAGSPAAPTAAIPGPSLPPALVFAPFDIVGDERISSCEHLYTILFMVKDSNGASDIYAGRTATFRLLADDPIRTAIIGPGGQFTATVDEKFIKSGPSTCRSQLQPKVLTVDGQPVF